MYNVNTVSIKPWKYAKMLLQCGHFIINYNRRSRLFREAKAENVTSDRTGKYTVATHSSLGKLILVKLEKYPYFLFPENEWYCSKIVVTTPEGDALLFTCYRWISRNEPVELRGGKVMDTLPSIGQTAIFAANAWVMTDKYSGRDFLGNYPEERFDEPAPKQMIKDFQEELARVSEEITARNSKLAVPFTYMNPAVVENSVTI